MRLEEFPIVKEGLLLFSSLCLLTVILAFFVPRYITFLLIFIDLFILYFFRNPRRIIPDSQDCVVAPADGKVVDLGECSEDRFGMNDVIKISIFMSVFNAHVNRIPSSGRIIDVFYKKGKFFSANFDKASILNEQNAVLLEREDKRKILFVQIAGLIARRIICWVKKGDKVSRGERFGLICFGSRVDIFLPSETRINVKIGQRVRGGETILGYLS